MERILYGGIQAKAVDLEEGIRRQGDPSKLKEMIKRMNEGHYHLVSLAGVFKP